ncbi:Leucine-rich repeat domain, L domain-like [Cinara cedri]|uniref:Leucine-rich repeat domain, L domain-like n=1 Tax=Cinara cedri TaxID=506608 RepID=A0A5E4NFJ1_9HEMI|nr:Leucine-rich repeat domain, L domain-like [Cinara cedri]
MPAHFCKILEKISIDLEVLEIGDCKCLPDDFPMYLKKLINLRSLRLINCHGRWDKFAMEYFSAIRSLKKLKNLELVNIVFNQCVKEQLEQCDGITGLLIIPAIYLLELANNNCHLLHCLEKLSKTLKHVVLGITHGVLQIGNLYNVHKVKNHHNLGYIMGGETRKCEDCIPILRSKILQPDPLDLRHRVTHKDKAVDVQILTVSFLQYWLNSMMVNTKCKVIKIHCSEHDQMYLSEHFNDL